MPSKSCHESTSPRPAFAATISSNPARASTSTRSKPSSTACRRSARRPAGSASGQRPPSDSGRQVNRIGFVAGAPQGGQVEVAHEVRADLEEVGDVESAAIRATTAPVVSSVRLTAIAVLPP